MINPRCTSAWTFNVLASISAVERCCCVTSTTLCSMKTEAATVAQAAVLPQRAEPAIRPSVAVRVWFNQPGTKQTPFSPCGRLRPNPLTHTLLSPGLSHCCLLSPYCSLSHILATQLENRCGVWPFPPSETPLKPPTFIYNPAIMTQPR